MFVEVMLTSATNDGIDAETYPLTTEELLARYGDAELDLPNGTERLADVVERQGKEVYHSPDDVRLAVYNGVSHRAVGRRFYSDRDPTPPGAVAGHEQVSF